MRIVIDARSLMNKNLSGVGEYAYQLIRHLLALDKKNEYFLFYNEFGGLTADFVRSGSPDPDLGILPEGLRLKADNYIRRHIPNKLLNLSLHCFNYPSLEKLLGFRPDVFFMPNLNFAPMHCNSKSVLTFHDLSFEIYPEFFNWKRRIWHKLINPQGLAKTVDKIIAVSENTKRDLVRLYNLSPDKIKVIYSGIDDDLARVDSPEILDAIRKKYNLPEKFILFLGTIEPRKNIEGIISAYERFLEKSGGRDYHLVLAGGLGWLYEPILNRIKNSKEKLNIHYIGYAGNADKSALYSLACLFFFPSFYEGFGFPVLEAHVCGTPVVTSPHSSLGEISSPYAILVNPYNIEEMAQGIEDGLKRKITGEDIASIKRKFNWEDTARNVLELFNK